MKTTNINPIGEHDQKGTNHTPYVLRDELVREWLQSIQPNRRPRGTKSRPFHRIFLALKRLATKIRTCNSGQGQSGTISPSAKQVV